jgi:hypothetical protein
MRRDAGCRQLTARTVRKNRSNTDAFHIGVPDLAPDLRQVVPGDSLITQDEAIGEVQAGGVAELHHDFRHLAGQGRVDEQGGDQIVPLLHQVALGKGHRRVALQSGEEAADGVVWRQVGTARGGPPRRRGRRLGEQRAAEHHGPGDQSASRGSRCSAQSKPQLTRPGLWA